MYHKIQPNNYYSLSCEFLKPAVGERPRNPRFSAYLTLPDTQGSYNLIDISSTI